MTRADRLGPDGWNRLEALWDIARDLSPEQRAEFLASQEVDDSIREELEALLAHASAAEPFFHAHCRPWAGRCGWLLDRNIVSRRNKQRMGDLIN